ncbi:MAG: hypothetical protein IIZ97_07310 [Prevotella sp.]|nr:hypothetical protein [Prevotella sp.]
MERMHKKGAAKAVLDVVCGKLPCYLPLFAPQEMANCQPKCVMLVTKMTHIAFMKAYYDSPKRPKTPLNISLPVIYKNSSFFRYLRPNNNSLANTRILEGVFSEFS